MPGPMGVLGATLSSVGERIGHWGRAGQGLPKGRCPWPWWGLAYAPTGQVCAVEVPCCPVWLSLVAFDPACLMPGPGPALYLGPAGVQ